jgi:lipoprotein-anchoring transpeptidase ErfK/SrfK
VVVHLATQQLEAYQNGCRILVTPVTTGRPALSSPTGSFHVLVKRPSWQMTSPYPPGSPQWYPSTTVHEWVELAPNGLSLHSAEWEPLAAFGPGSEAGPYATDGTLNVPSESLQRLYQWLRVGTPVVIQP